MKKYICDAICDMFQIRYIEEFTLQLNNSNQLRFTASLGVSQVNILTDHDIEFCIKRADDGLYEAKNSSKNKVCIKVS